MPDLKEAVKRILPERKKTPPIISPAADAQRRLDMPCHVRNRRNEWRRWMSSCTTNQFESSEHPYSRHCGPTAITNMILTLNRRYHILTRSEVENGVKGREKGRTGGELPKEGLVWYFPAAAKVFERVSRVGMRRGIYWNTDILHTFGGTYDILTGVYIKACFRELGIEGFSVSRRLGSGPEDYLEALQEGSILYLQLHHDSCYGNHHVICYGAVEVESMDHRHHRIYLEIADGWARETRYLAVEDMSFTHFYAVRAKNG
jgi:hypothetical protein